MANQVESGGLVELSILGLSYIPPPNHVYHDDGYVNSVLGHRRRLDIKYGCLKGEDAYKGEVFSGEHCVREETIDGIQITHNHIFYLDHGFPPSNIDTRGHEEYHAAQFHDKETKNTALQDLLAQKILAEQGVCIDFSAIDLDEIKADLAGIFALYRWGFHPELLRDRPERPREYFFNMALEIYEQARLPERTSFIPSNLTLEPRVSFG